MKKGLNRYLRDRTADNGYAYRNRLWTVIRSLETEPFTTGGQSKARALYNFINGVREWRLRRVEAGLDWKKRYEFFGVSVPEIDRWLSIAKARLEAATYKEEHYMSLSERQGAEIHRRKLVMDYRDKEMRKRVPRRLLNLEE